MFTSDSLGARLTPFFAVVTLPAGILAFMFGSLQLAAVVFVVGWLLLVPASAVLFGPTNADQLESVAELQEAAERLDEDNSSEGRDADPVDELRDRYARGEIDEAEFERRLEALLETDGVDAADDESVERAVERLDEIQQTDDDGTALERELE